MCHGLKQLQSTHLFNVLFKIRDHLIMGRARQHAPRREPVRMRVRHVVRGVEVTAAAHKQHVESGKYGIGTFI